MTIHQFPAAAERSAAENDGRLAELHRQYRATGSAEVREELVSRYQRLAVKLTSRYAYRSDVEDLRQVALMALVHALNRFDPDRGVQFASYAVPTITGALKRYFRDQAWRVKPPRRLQENYLEVRHVFDELQMDLGRPPSVQEVSQRVGLPEDDVRASLQAAAAREHVSLETADGAAGTSLLNVLCDNASGLDESDNRLLVEQLLRSLTQPERAVIVLSFFERMSQRDIARRLGTNQVHVSRMKGRALERLRRLSLSSQLAS